MKKIRLAVHKSAAQNVLETVHRLGAVEFTELSEKDSLKKDEKTVFELNYISSRLDMAVSLLSKYEKSSFLKDALEGRRQPVTEDEMARITQNARYNNVIEEVYSIREALNEIEAKKTELAEEEVLLTPWEGLSMNLSFPMETRSTKTLLLSGDAEEIASFAQTICTSPERICEQPSETTLSITYLKKENSEILEELSRHKLDTVTLPKRRGTPAEELERIGRAKKKADKRRAYYEARARTLTKHLPELRVASDAIRWRKERYDRIHDAHGTENVVIFEGWCPERALPILERELKEQTDLVEVTEVSTDQTPPVEIRNNKTVQPFETITRLYGMPSHKDFDPTPYLAGFFFVFFGICLSDVGYGLLLMSFTAATLLVYNLSHEMKLFFKLLFAGGLSSALVGVLFGGYFGIDTSAPFFPEILRNMQYYDPIGDPLPIFYLALALGVIQILLGMILSIIREAQNGNLSEGVLSTGPWLALFASLGLWASASFEIIAQPDGFEYVWLIYASLIAIIATSGRHYKGAVAKIFMGILGLYNAVGYLSDVLSYSRLLALGLATGALAFSVNLIAGIAYESIPYVGFIAFAVVLVLGHLFNLVVNLLGAFIHTARLQFVEFFGKFITDTGRPFKPFYRKEQNVFLTKATLPSNKDGNVSTE